MNKIKYEDRSFSVGKGFANVETHSTIDGVWTNGLVATPHGFVDVYTEKDFTRLDFICEGRLYMRRYGVPIKKRTLIRFAKRFAKEIMQDCRLLNGKG